MNVRSLRWWAGAIVGLTVLAVLNALTTGHDISTAPQTLAYFALFAAIFFGGAFLLGRLHLGRGAIAAIVAALFPAVLLSAVVSGTVESAHVPAVVGVAPVLFVATFATVFAILDPRRLSSR